MNLKEFALKSYSLSVEPTFKIVRSIDDVPELQTSYFLYENGKNKWKDFWTLENAPLKITLNLKRGGSIELEINQRWMTDFGSIPRFLRSLVPHAHPTLINGFIFHDAAYQSGKLSKEVSDFMCDEIQRLDKASGFLRSLVRFGLRSSAAKKSFDKSQMCNSAEMIKITWPDK